MIRTSPALARVAVLLAGAALALGLGPSPASASPTHHSTSHHCVTVARNTTACTWWMYWKVSVDSTGRNRLHIEPHVSIDSNGTDEIKTIAIQRQFIGHPQKKFPIRTDLSYSPKQKGRGYLTRHLFSHTCAADIRLRIKFTYERWAPKPVNSLVSGTTWGYFYNFNDYMHGASCSPFHP